MASKSDNALGEFEGRLITKTTIALTNAGDGLSQALKIDPKALHQGEKVYVLIEATVGKITFDPYDDGVCARVQTLRSEVATLVDESFAESTIAEQKVKIKAAKDAEAGQGDFLKLAEDHEAGLHDAPAPGCPQCATPAEDASKAPADGDNVKPIGSRRRKADPKATT